MSDVLKKNQIFIFPVGWFGQSDKGLVKQENSKSMQLGTLPLYRIFT